MKITTPDQRQLLIPSYLKFIRFLISLLKKKNTFINNSIEKIEKYSYAVCEYSSNIKIWNLNTNTLIDKLKNISIELDSFDYNQKELFHVKRGVRSSRGLNFGYDLNMIEFCNVEDHLYNFMGAKYIKIKEISQLVCKKLEIQRNKNLCIKFVKIYHYESVEFPRPLHFDSPYDYSYKIFFFLDKVSDQNGAYCIIPSTHNFFFNKLMRIYNMSPFNKIWLDGNDGSFYKSSDAIKFKNFKENNFFITKQNAVHGDMPAQKGFNKTAIVFHILPN